MGKRLASASLERPKPAKKANDVTSMGSVDSRVATDAKAGNEFNISQGMSMRQATASPDMSTIEGLEGGSLLDYMLTLLLQCSTRLRDLEAINYYTHVIPTTSNIYKVLEETYQAYLY